MTTETDKLAEMAQLFHDTYEALAPAFGYETRPDTKAFDPESPNGKLMCATVAKVRTAIIASLCGDVEQDGFRLVSVNAGFTELLEALDRADRKGYMPDAIYSAYEGFECRDPASTVAALKARAAELEDFIVGIGQDLHHERVADWYPEGANNAALAMSESMRLIGNRCVDFDAALKKGQS